MADPQSDESASEGVVAVDDATARSLARTALLVTAGLYLGYAALRWASAAAGFEVGPGVLLIAAFYFVPGFVLRRRPELAERWQVGPDFPIPAWSWRGLKVAGVAMALVFPIFALGFFFFYWRACAGDLSTLAPVVWVESLTPASGSLEGFLGRLCRWHGGELWPAELRVPRRWVQYGGLAFVYWAALEVFVVALPEEVFHRGYLMSALEQRWPPERRVFGVPFGWAAVLSSALFAVGHLVGDARTDRLFTFFPSLLFAWLWRKSDSLWAPALFHAASNLLMQILLASTFPGR